MNTNTEILEACNFHTNILNQDKTSLGAILLSRLIDTKSELSKYIQKEYGLSYANAYVTLFLNDIKKDNAVAASVAEGISNGRFLLKSFLLNEDDSEMHFDKYFALYPSKEKSEVLHKLGINENKLIAHFEALEG